MEKKPHGYWRQWENVETELREVMASYYGLIPGRTEMIALGYGALLMAVQVHHGGLTAVRERMGIGGLKRCPRCERILPRTEFRIKKKPSAGETFRDSICKRCSSEIVALYRQTHSGRVAELYRGAKSRAQQRGVAFTLTKKWMADRLHQIDWTCEVTGMPFHLHGQDHFWKDPYAVSCDRIDPSGGYTENNVQFVLSFVNWAKGSLSMGEFRSLCKAVAQGGWEDGG